MKNFAHIITVYLLTLGVLTAQSELKSVALRSDEETPKISISQMKWEKGLLPPVSDEYKPKQGPPDVTQPNDDFRKTPVKILPERGLQTIYWYQALFKNDGMKKIKGFVWEYVFYDLRSKEELGRQLFFNFKQIGVNKSAVIRNASYTPPSDIVTYGSLEKDGKSPYSEKSAIRCILYSDNSLWKRPDLSPQDCEVSKLRERLFWRKSLRY